MSRGRQGSTAKLTAERTKDDAMPEQACGEGCKCAERKSNTEAQRAEVEARWERAPIREAASLLSTVIADSAHGVAGAIASAADHIGKLIKAAGKANENALLKMANRKPEYKVQFYGKAGAEEPTGFQYFEATSVSVLVQHLREEHGEHGWEIHPL